MTDKPKILLTFGTRPDAVKMAPLIKALEREDTLDHVVAVTAQHREMLDQILGIFNIEPHYDMNIMKDRQSLEDIASAIMRELPPILETEKPDIVLVHGDTSTAFFSALVCFYRSIPVGHVEAGLRTSDPMLPFPEEMNRRLIDQVATLLLAPTETAKISLLAEGNKSEMIHVTGNTVVDAVLEVAKIVQKEPIPDYIKEFEQLKIILVTAHRRESWEDGLKRISLALQRITEVREDVGILFPIHKNPRVREEMEPILGNLPRVKLIEPLDYLSFVQTMIHSHIILTDSGGIQEEAPSLNIPVLVMRDVTERGEGIGAGCVNLIGTSTNGIVEGTLEVLNDEANYIKMSNAANPFGDGRASERIICALKMFLNVPTKHCPDFKFLMKSNNELTNS